MLLTFPHFKIRHEIHEQRRKNIADRLKLMQMARVFESDSDRQQREALEQLRRQDWK